MLKEGLMSRFFKFLYCLFVSFVIVQEVFFPEFAQPLSFMEWVFLVFAGFAIFI